MRYLLGLVVVKAVEEVDAALVAAKAVTEAVEGSKAVAAFRAVADFKAVNAATIMITIGIFKNFSDFGSAGFI